jgi:hypothetical protein
MTCKSTSRAYREHAGRALQCAALTVLLSSHTGCEPASRTSTEAGSTATSGKVPQPTTLDQRMVNGPCTPKSGCKILARHPIGSEFATSRGILTANGKLTCDPAELTCPSDLGSSNTSQVVEVSSECAYWHKMFLVSGAAVYLAVPQSVGGQGGPGWALKAIAGAEPASFLPLGGGFSRDQKHAFYWAKAIPDAHPDSLEVLECPLACDSKRCFSNDDLRGD